MHAMAFCEPSALALVLCLLIVLTGSIIAWYSVRRAPRKVVATSPAGSSRPLTGAEFSYHIMECKIPGASKVVSQCRFALEGECVGMNCCVAL
jgi:hypothetical protein